MSHSKIIIIFFKNMRINAKLYFKLIQFLPHLSKFFTLDNGFIEELEDERDHVFGATNNPKIVLQEDGQWTKFIPKGELQSKTSETMACVTFSLLNAIEALNLRKFNEIKDYSDRFLAKVSNTSRGGNSMNTVIEALRKHYGTVREDMWKNDGGSWEHFYQTIPSNILEMGKMWIKEYDLKYEKVANNKKLLMEALKYSPLWTAGFAWYEKNGLYRSYGNPNHAFLLIGYVENSHWLVLDSYSPFIKKLDWNFNFYYTRVLMLAKKSLKYNQDKLNALRERGLDYIMLAQSSGTVFDLTKEIPTETSYKELVDKGIVTMAKNGKLIGITDEFYNSLLV